MTELITQSGTLPTLLPVQPFPQGKVYVYFMSQDFKPESHKLL